MTSTPATRPEARVGVFPVRWTSPERLTNVANSRLRVTFRERRRSPVKGFRRRITSHEPSPSRSAVVVLLALVGWGPPS